jgi:adenosylcobinamide-GDP ribazoletransferase
MVYGLVRQAGVPPLLAACWALAAIVLATGALHEDGLADTADGFGGGATPARKLEIMRDSRIGSYGALALIGSVAVRVAAMAALGAPWRVAAALCAAGALGRAAIAVLLVMLRPAREDGLGAAMRDGPAVGAMVAIALAGTAALLLLPLATALAASLLAFTAAFALARLARAQIGGTTGDVLGAAAVLGECVALTAMAAA